MKKYISKPIMVILVAILVVAFAFMYISMDGDEPVFPSNEEVTQEEVEATQDPNAYFEYDYALENEVNDAESILVVDIKDDYSDYAKVRFLKECPELRAQGFNMKDILDGKDAVLESAKEESVKSMILYFDVEKKGNGAIITSSNFETYDEETETNIGVIMEG